MDRVLILPVPSASLSMWFYKMQFATIYLPGGRQRKKVGGTAIFPVAKQIGLQTWSSMADSLKDMGCKHKLCNYGLRF